MRILLTNDDGIFAPGIAALYEAARELGEVHVIAPAEVQSAMSHGVTFNRPLQTRIHRATCSQGKHLFEGISVDGRPADCVKLALASLIKQPVDLVLSGINEGANIGINVIYSGTVAAAMEAGFMGVPAIAMSLHIGDSPRTRWDLAVKQAKAVLKRILARTLDPHTVLNVNIPILDDGAEPAGIKVVPISTSPIVDNYTHSPDADGGSYMAASHLKFHHTPADSDVEAIFNRYITVTPLHFDLTRHTTLDAWNKHFL